MDYKFEIDEIVRIRGTPHIGEVIGRGPLFSISPSNGIRYNGKKVYFVEISHERGRILNEEDLEELKLTTLEGITKSNN